MSVLTRLAGPGDAVAIADIHTDARRVASRLMGPTALHTSVSLGQCIEVWGAWLEQTKEPSFTLLAERQLEPLGVCAVSAPSFDSDPHGNTAEISSLYVAPEAWRTGVASTLLDTALARLHIEGWEAVTAWVFASNLAALAFYARFGMEPDGAKARHHASDELRVRLAAEL